MNSYVRFAPEIRMFPDELFKLVPYFLIGLFVVSILMIIIAGVVRGSDNGKPVIHNNGKILEKTLSSATVEWYIVQLDSGERKKLRNLRPKDLILQVGDSGHIEYQGETILKFERYPNSNS